MSDPASIFSDPDAVARYGDAPKRIVPGFLDLQRMTALLLAEKIDEKGHVLVLGAGGGLELKAFATWYPEWLFTGIDPSVQMLDLARKTLGSLGARIQLQDGYIESAPVGPFDGATCLLTLHFIPKKERLRTLIELRKRLKPGAPLVVAHHSFSQEKAEKTFWLGRYAAFASASGIKPENAFNAADAVGKQLPVLSPKQDEALLRDAGFRNISLFYMGFSFHGWIAYNQ